MSMKKISRRDFLKDASIVTVAGTLTACGGGSSASTSAVASGSTAAAGGKYKIALSNAFMGNDWRQIMIKCAEVAATKEPYASKLDLTIINSENSAEAQSAAIDAMVEQGYNAILVDASSSSALLPSIKRAQDAGIVVVSFDSVVIAEASTPCRPTSSPWLRHGQSTCATNAVKVPKSPLIPACRLHQRQHHLRSCHVRLPGR